VNESLGVEGEGVEDDDGARSVVVVQKVEEDKSKKGGR
jgi:hypothetical protein